MKIAALVSVVAAGRQARDAQSLFDKMLGDHNNNIEQRNFVFSETDSLYQIFQFYMGSKGKVQIIQIIRPMSPNRPSDNDFEPMKRPRFLKSR